MGDKDDAVGDWAVAEEGLGRAGREAGSDWYVERKASEEGNWYEVGKALEGG